MKGKKEFFISVARPGKKTDVLTAGRRLTLGRDYACDITIDSAVVPDSHLFIKQSGKDKFTVRLLKGMDGSVRKGSESTKISALIETGFIKKSGECYLLELTPGLTLALVIGNSTIEASYGEALAPTIKRRKIYIPFISSHELAFLSALIISAIIHISFAYYLSTIEIKKKPFEEKVYEIAPRFARLIFVPEEKAVERRIIGAMEEMEEKEPKQEEKMPEKETPVKGAKVKNGKLVRRIATKGVLGVIGAKKGLMEGGGMERLWREVDEIIKEARTAPLGEETEGIEGIVGGAVSATGEEVLKEWEKKKTAEDIIRERTALKRVAPDKKHIQEKRKREEADIYRIVRSHVGGLKYLYNNALRKNSTLRGTVTVRLVITKDGEVEEATIENSTLLNPELERAIIERIYLWRFASIKDAENFVIDYTFDFSPMG